MNVFLTGGTGFVGRAVIDALLERGHAIHALVNHRSLTHSSEQVKSFPGGLFDDASLDNALRECDAVIHLVGIIAEKQSKGITFDRIHVQGTCRVVDAAKRFGITRFLHMSALGSGPNAPAKYQQTKFQAEQNVRASGLDWTIIQPSLIHGPGGDFTRMELGWARGHSLPFLFMPYFGSGLLGRGKLAKIQPVYVEDVARAFAEALTETKTVGEVYPLGGPEQMTWPQMHRIAAEVVVGHPRATLGIPAWYAGAITHIVPPALLPFTQDQVLMSQQDNISDLTKFIAAFGWTPQPFEQTLRRYLPTM